jgi:S-(hydroxymethyl)glutathione dehydrogenase/alcohol dehydrogenase
MIRKDGKIVDIGVPAMKEIVSISVKKLLYTFPRFMVSRMGSTNLRFDVPKLIELYRQGRLKLDELVTGRYRLEEINNAIESTEMGQALRNVIQLL